MLGSHFSLGATPTCMEVCWSCKTALGDEWETEVRLTSENRCHRCGMPPAAVRIRKRAVDG
ncbi:Uncharacterised protein (plasmid) [Tsukamurella tyrosinosolvens]|uniref:Uncharacterized protein n=1 Tax=Tsukamurella tyrosinosolvens TaxID=57704 RepID=A0A1H4UYW2_TSUTY|nr:hypothetical protein SAMN04489793_3085 [Tsukamurella tyrosinosolvens]VEH90791.1 Uncharacterised protein [Tsukamurella tyrosinosolvens]